MFHFGTVIQFSVRNRKSSVLKFSNVVPFTKRVLGRSHPEWAEAAEREADTAAGEGGARAAARGPWLRDESTGFALAGWALWLGQPADQKEHRLQSQVDPGSNPGLLSRGLCDLQQVTRPSCTSIFLSVQRR